MFKSSAHEGRNWKPSKTDEQYNAELLRDTLDAFRAVAEETGQTTTHLTMVVAMRPTTEGMPR
ncbi:hypothetical protein MUK60_10155 [Streptomyces sp. LRE541]|uniref:hypothetical protein n=1 Tax=Streptomyces sp. LRE541 TaxID=2931983 RepID=UPI00200E322A|nr:hypothetical protein [Streptomyces sp. LRE541]UPZ28147.1 hypothetical protein MUK60_10155 [Streptomyces sp. LRE541]